MRTTMILGFLALSGTACTDIGSGSLLTSGMSAAIVGEADGWLGSVARSGVPGAVARLADGRAASVRSAMVSLAGGTGSRSGRVGPSSGTPQCTAHVS